MQEQEYKIENIKSFELADIFDCGQCFRWNKQEDGSYTGIFRKNVINEEFMNEIKRLKANGCHVKIIFGYKNGNKNVNGPDEIANELMKRDSLGYAKPEEVKEIVSELYNLLGKENFVYYPPLHAKIIIVDDEYMFMGSHNWLSNAGKTEEKKRAIEGTIITTSSDSISYTKEELFS